MTLQNAGSTVNENSGSVEVCLELTDGELGIDVIVELNTGGNTDTATGMPL